MDNNTFKIKSIDIVLSFTQFHKKNKFKEQINQIRKCTKVEPCIYFNCHHFEVSRHFLVLGVTVAQSVPICACIFFNES